MARGRFQPAEFERKWQERWAKQGIYYASDDDPRAEILQPRHVPLPVGRPAHRPLVQLHRRRHLRPLHAHARLQRHASPSASTPSACPPRTPPSSATSSRATWTLDNIAKMRAQMRPMGAGWDWPREVVTCLPDYYRWTQWLFLQFYKHGPGLPHQGARQLVPHLQHDAGQRAGGQRRAASAAARRSSGARSTSGCCRITNYADELLRFDGTGLAREDAPDADQLDRPQRGRRDPLPPPMLPKNAAARAIETRRDSGLHHPARHHLRRRRSSCWPRSIRWWSG